MVRATFELSGSTFTFGALGGDPSTIASPSQWNQIATTRGVPSALRRRSSTVQLEASISIVSSPESRSARLACALSSFRESPVPRKVGRLTLASPARCGPSPSFTEGTAPVVESSPMYSLRMTQVVSGREHITQQNGEILKLRFAKQSASKGATNYLTVFVRWRSGTRTLSALRHLEGCSWTRNTATLR